MVEIGKITRLTARRIRSGNPEWVNDALSIRILAERSPANQQTSFGRHWEVMEAARGKCLPYLAAARVPVRALVIGAGGQPYPEVFEVKDMLMKAGVEHQLSVMDIRRETLLGEREFPGFHNVLFGIQDVTRILLSPDQLLLNKVPPKYYSTFLGNKTVMTGHPVHIDVPEEAKRNIQLFEGDIVTSKLPPQRFDLVFCFNVLEHYCGLLRQLGVLNIANGLRSGGLLVMEGATDVGLKEFYKDIPLMDWFNPSRLAELGFQKGDSPLVWDRLYGPFALRKE